MNIFFSERVMKTQELDSQLLSLSSRLRTTTTQCGRGWPL
jgi:hypothetical protein